MDHIDNLFQRLFVVLLVVIELMKLLLQISEGGSRVVMKLINPLGQILIGSARLVVEAVHEVLEVDVQLSLDRADLLNDVLRIALKARVGYSQLFISALECLNRTLQVLDYDLQSFDFMALLFVGRSQFLNLETILLVRGSQLFDLTLESLYSVFQHIERSLQLLCIMNVLFHDAVQCLSIGPGKEVVDNGEEFLLHLGEGLKNWHFEKING